MEETHHLLRYRTPGQRKFNERFVPKVNSSPGPDVVNGPWMSNDVVNRFPGVRHDFDQSRDPIRAKQMHDLQMSEAQTGHRGQEEQTGSKTGRDSTMIRQDQPKAILRPPKEIRASVDNQRFRSRWLAEQRAAVMSQHSQTKTTDHDQPLISPQYKTPEG